jgi:hypothetical protein
MFLWNIWLCEVRQEHLAERYINKAFQPEMLDAPMVVVHHRKTVSIKARGLGCYTVAVPRFDFSTVINF